MNGCRRECGRSQCTKYPRRLTALVPVPLVMLPQQIFPVIISIGRADHDMDVIPNRLLRI